jgi:N-acetylglucosamine-6-phosphate deacetylase
MPGLAAAALMSDKVTAELIVDGIHIAPEMVDLVLKMKGARTIILVTDCSEALELSGGTFCLDDRKVAVVDGAPRFEDGVLCGTVLTMNMAIKNAMRFAGLTLEEAVKMATVNPARVLGLEGRKGAISVGMDADIVLFDGEFDVKAVLMDGRVRFNKMC